MIGSTQQPQQRGLVSTRNDSNRMRAHQTP